MSTATATNKKTEEKSSKKVMNKMREIVIEKLILNIGVGASGDKMTKAIKVLKDLTGQDPVTTRAKYTIRSFSIRRNEEIGTHVTVRGSKALELLKLGLKVKDNELKKKNFSNTGNFGFGINEHIDLGIKYDPNTGIYGMDFYAVLKRKGLRVTQRKRASSRLGNFNRVKQEDAQKWFVEKLGGLLI
jgi:large subunit ribosomal protein L11e